MRSLQQLQDMGLGNGAFNIGYGKVSAGDIAECERRRCQVLEVFPDGDVWIEFLDDATRTPTKKWREITPIDDKNT